MTLKFFKYSVRPSRKSGADEYTRGWNECLDVVNQNMDRFIDGEQNLHPYFAGIRKKTYTAPTN
jgi:hypothetical protein